MIEAVVAQVLGTLLLFHGQAAPLILIQFLGLYFLIKGLLSLAAIFTNPRGWFLKLLIGMLGLFAGILLLDHPFWRGLQSENNLVYLVAGVAFAIGVVTLFQVFVNGGFSVVLLGLILYLDWPDPGLDTCCLNEPAVYWYITDCHWDYFND